MVAPVTRKSCDALRHQALHYPPKVGFLSLYFSCTRGQHMLIARCA
jgi:hypothetical protein